MRPGLPRLHRPGSIAGRMLLGTVALTAVALTATTVSATVLVKDYLYDRVSAQLSVLAGSAVRGPLGVAIRDRDLPSCQDLARPGSGEGFLPSDFTVAFLDQDGQLLCRLGTAGRDDAAPTPPAAELPALANAATVLPS
ncbi:MAG: hypothetical protein ACRCYU_10795, partial [Nocardioides sp.]